MARPAQAVQEVEWFAPQRDSGSHWRTNCGPAVATMAARWYYAWLGRTFLPTVEAARRTNPMSGRGWNIENIHAYLQEYGVESEYRPGGFNRNTAKHLLEEKKIIIVALFMHDISETTCNDCNIGRFSGITGQNHYLVLKDYVAVEGEDYFEVYDPASWIAETGALAGKEMGKDRLYLVQEVQRSAQNTSAAKNYARGGYIVIQPPAKQP